MTKLHVVVHRQGTRYIATTEVPGERALFTQRFEHDPTGLTRLGPLWLLEYSSLPEEDQAKLAELRQKGTGAAQVAQYGYRLFRYLFGDGAAFDACIKRQTGSEPLQLVINLGADTLPLWRLPWEYLHNGRAFLGLDDRVRVSRCLGSFNALPSRPVPAPLRILFVIPSPSDQPAIDYEHELISMHKALAESIERETVLLHVLHEATRQALFDALQRDHYHVLHYLGQGTYDLEQRQGFLKIENETGMTEWIDAREFADLIKGQGLQLVVLQAYQNAPVGMIDAFNEVAAQALRQEIPEILTIPVGLSQAPSQALQRVLYSSLGSESTTPTALQRIRKALQSLSRAQNLNHHRFDWGLPILYHRTDPYALIEQGPKASTPRDRSVSPRGRSPYESPPLVNRTKEIRAIRAALQEGARIFYIWGKAGIGKSRLIAHLLRRPGIRMQDQLMIHCSELEDPLLAFGRIASFWRAHAAEYHTRAAGLLLDSTKDPFERALQAQAYLPDARYAIIFEDIDTWFEKPRSGDLQNTAQKIAYDLLRNLLLGLLSAEAKTCYFFTGQRRWADLNVLPSEDHREIHLPLLQEPQAIQLMNTLPGLKLAPYEIKKALYWHLGGHPEALMLVSGWANAGHNLKALITSPPIRDRDTQAWIEYLARELIHHLDPGERQVLEAAAVLNRPFTARQLSELTSLDDHYATPLLDEWVTLGMVKPTRRDKQAHYQLHTLMQSCVLQRLTPRERSVLHRQAARYYGSPFLDAARRQALIRSGTVWADSRIAWLARDSNGILGLWLRRQSDPELQSQMLARSLAWHYHLIKAGAFEEASQIAHTLAPMLDQQGQGDLSRLLLQQSLIADDELKRAENMDTLARLRLQDGHLQSALEVYEEVVASLGKDKNKVQQAYILLRAGKIRQQMDDHKGAIDHYQRALKLMREEDDVEGEAQALHSLSTIYRETGNARQALVYSQAALECYQTLDHQQGLALVHYEQGLILKALSHNESALERFTASLEIARRLNDRVAIASTLIQIGEMFQRLNQEEMAVRALEEAANHYARLQSSKEQEVLSRLESIYAQQERFEQAVIQFRKAKSKPGT